MVAFLIGCDLTGKGEGGTDGPSDNGFVFSEIAYSLSGDTHLPAAHLLILFRRLPAKDRRARTRLYLRGANTFPEIVKHAKG
jgi:hypothetical protein